MAELERVAHLTQGEARGLLMTEVEAEIREEANRLVRQMEEEAKEHAGPAGARDPHRLDPAHRLRGRLRIDGHASCRSPATT